MSLLRQPKEERRRHARRPASGPITLWRTEFTRRKIEGRLVDTSEGGFRVAHGCAGLGPGLVVHFEHAAGEGIARTVWTRILADTVETGLVILCDRLADAVDAEAEHAVPAGRPAPQRALPGWGESGCPKASRS